MQDHYRTLGLNSSATQDEIRRAYRILARRYHPDVNPERSSEEKFKSISSAYRILSDAKKRSEYDADYERIQIARFADKFKETLRRAANNAATYRTASRPQHRPQTKTAQRNYQRWYTQAMAFLKNQRRSITNLFQRRRRSDKSQLASISIIEVSVSIKEAIFGQKKTIEIPNDNNRRKISINIPPGVKNGSVVRLKQKSKSKSAEEVVLIMRVAHHPFLSINNKGLVVEVPVSLSEAMHGASITLPTLDEPVVVKIPAGSQSGQEFRVRSKGILQKDGTRGDVIFRLSIRLPQSPQAVGLSDKIREIDRYYDEPLRKNFPSHLAEL